MNSTETKSPKARKVFKKVVLALGPVLAIPLLAVPGLASAKTPATGGDHGSCAGLPTAADLKHAMQQAAIPNNPDLNPKIRGRVGGLFEGKRQWGAVVNRAGQLCAWVTETDDPTQAWPGSQAIAKAKAYTANAFSHSDSPLSTARLYTLVQPGHSLYGLNQSNPFNPNYLLPPGSSDKAGPAQGLGQVAGGIITFGGGVPLYKNGKIIGGFGTSGDTACADHEMAKRVRDLLGLDPAAGPLADDIVYPIADAPSPFAHPQCPNTWRNGKQIQPGELPGLPVLKP